MVTLLQAAKALEHRVEEVIKCTEHFELGMAIKRFQRFTRVSCRWRIEG